MTRSGSFQLILVLSFVPIMSWTLQLSAIDRRSMLSFSSYMILVSNVPDKAFAFEGGVGGLGKTKPNTGVILRDGSVPIQNKQGIVTAEILSGKGNPILVEFTAPYPLLPTTSGLEARDLQQSESAFVQVVEGVKPHLSGEALSTILIEKVFGSRGKFGAYGSPTDIIITPQSTGYQDLYKVSFTTLTPGMRESERKLLLHCKWCDGDTLVMLLVGTTLQRFKSHESTLNQIATSFLAVDAPPTDLRPLFRRK